MICIVEDNAPADLCVTENKLLVRNCWFGERIQRFLEQEGYGANLPNVLDKHDGRGAVVDFVPGPDRRPKECGATVDVAKWR